MAGLSERGLGTVPKAIGLDGDVELVEFIEGDVPDYPMPSWVWSDKLLAEVGHRLREIHDGSQSLDLPLDGWRLPHVDPPEVFCHGDVTPYNMVFRDGRVVAFIDWDFAVPAPRLWDLGYAAYRWVSLTPPDHPDGRPQSIDEQWRRLGLLCDAYGDVDRYDVVDWAVRRLDHLVSLSLSQAADGNPAFIATVAAGHVELYAHDRDWLRATYLAQRW
jgi:hypothetical protein